MTDPDLPQQISGPAGMFGGQIIRLRQALKATQPRSTIQTAPRLRAFLPPSAEPKGDSLKSMPEPEQPLLSQRPREGL